MEIEGQKCKVSTKINLTYMVPSSLSNELLDLLLMLSEEGFRKRLDLLGCLY